MRIRKTLAIVAAVAMGMAAIAPSFLGTAFAAGSKFVDNALATN